MAQANNHFQMFTFVPRGSDTLAAGAALYIPSSFYRAHHVIIVNNDATADLAIYTDPSDATATGIAPAAGGQFDILLNPTLAGFGSNELVCYLKGTGASPVIYIYE